MARLVLLACYAADKSRSKGVNMKIRNLVARLLIAVMTGVAASPPAYSSAIATDRASDRERILVLLDRAEVKEQLEAHGVRPSDAKARVAALTDEEVTQLAASMDAAPAGGNAGAAVYAVMVAGGFIVLAVLAVIALVGVGAYKGAKFVANKAAGENGKEPVTAAGDGTP